MTAVFGDSNRFCVRRQRPVFGGGDWLSAWSLPLVNSLTTHFAARQQWPLPPAAGPVAGGSTFDSGSAIVLKLESAVDVGALEQGDRLLEGVARFRRDAQFLALNLHFDAFGSLVAH